MTSASRCVVSRVMTVTLCEDRTGIGVLLAYTGSKLSVTRVSQLQLDDTHHDGTILCTGSVEVGPQRVTVVLVCARITQCFGMLRT